MLKKNKVTIILSTALILLPMLFGILLWNDLPDRMSTHWGADGNVDGFGSRAFVVFGMPAIFLALHFMTLLIVALDKNQREQAPKAVGIVFWIMPMISLAVSASIYCVALGRELYLFFLMPALLGMAFIWMGNYMPKIKRNSTLGIKIVWTLQNEENWNKTHRFGGKVMVAGGFAVLLSAFLPFGATVAVFVGVMIAIAVLPMLYSYRIYKQHQAEGIAYVAAPKSKGEKAVSRIAMIVVPVLLAGVAVIMFTGNIAVTCEDTAFQIQATYWSELEVAYTEIDTIEYRKDLDVGYRANGFSSARLSLGIFQNEEFGAYTLYAYAGAREFVVLTSGDKTLVIGLQDAGDTQAVYDAIAAKL